MRIQNHGIRGLLLSTLCAVVPALAVSTSPVAAQARGGPQEEDAPPPINESEDALLRVFRWRSIGPAGMGGRVDDIAVVESNPSVIYIGMASAGAFKTVNRGTTWEPVFDTYGSASIGAVAVSQSNPDVVYVGTGEPNNRQSSTFGDGVYKSTDAGGTFTHVGLRETQTIARIVVHPTNPDVVYVAAVGRLYGPNPERGVYRTTDGGVTWSRILHVDEDTGVTDLIMDPSDPNTLYAASYQRRRTAFGFNGGGPGSGLWKTVDGGAIWSRLEGNGLPGGTMGRIALAVSRSNPSVVYAQIEVAPDRAPPLKAANDGPPRRQQQQDPDPDPEVSGIWRSDDGGASWQFRGNNNVRPMYFSQIRVDPNDPDIVYTAGVQFYKSTDGARTFETIRGFGHVDHHAIWIDPANSDHLLIGNDGGIDVSWDQAATFESLRTLAHGQFYQVSVDMRRPYRVCGGLQDNGSWCGPSGVRSSTGILNQDWYNVGGGDGFYTQVDPTDPAIVYSESQNGNIRRTDLRTGRTRSIRPRPPTRNDSTTSVVPSPPRGERFRWNWNTPVILSPHNPRVVYTGANRFFKSLDRGETWTMSEDLTKRIDRDTLALLGMRLGTLRCPSGPGAPDSLRGRSCILSRNDGVGAFGTITTLSESPVLPGVIWVGTDDGNVQLSLDGGKTFGEVGRNIPGPRDYYVSRVESSYADPAAAYVSLDGHRSDDLRPYVYVTRDYGATWRSIAANLPERGNVNVIKQDPVNPSLLYAGTEFGFFVSLDGGAEWKRFMTGLPVVRVDDVVVHPRDGDLVLGTHGRSIWILDDITPLQRLTPEALAADAHLFQPRPAVAWLSDRQLARAVTGAKNFRGESPAPGTAIHYHLKSAGDSVAFTIADVTGKVVRNLKGPGDSGLNRVQWNLLTDPPSREEDAEQQGGPGGRGGPQRQRPRFGPPVEPGTYLLTMTARGQTRTARIVVEEDRWLPAR